MICATTSIDDQVLGDRTFDWVVVDEACQCTESAVLDSAVARAANSAGRRPLPIAPHGHSPVAAREGYARSMLERLVDTHGLAITRQLDVQYRMHETIMRFSSAQFYNDTLAADESVRSHLLSDLPDVASSPLTTEPVSFIDTAGAAMTKSKSPMAAAAAISKRDAWC